MAAAFVVTVGVSHHAPSTDTGRWPVFVMFLMYSSIMPLFFQGVPASFLTPMMLADGAILSGLRSRGPALSEGSS